MNYPDDDEEYSAVEPDEASKWDHARLCAPKIHDWMTKNGYIFHTAHKASTEFTGLTEFTINVEIVGKDHVRIQCDIPDGSSSLCVRFLALGLDSLSFTDESAVKMLENFQ